MYKKNRGSAVTVILFASMLIFIILPVFAAVIEKYILLNKANIIQDAVDVSNIAIYNTLDHVKLGKSVVDLATHETLITYRRVLAKNLQLNDDLVPLEGSLIDGHVTISELQIFKGGDNCFCPVGKKLTRTTVHSRLLFPIKPSLFRKLILGHKAYYELEIHVDTEIPINS